MNRRAMFLSVFLTVFMIAMLSGVITIYKALRGTTTQMTDAITASNPAILPVAEATVLPTATQISPKDAAAIAARYLNRQDIYMVEAAVLNNVDVYKVTFSSGDLVYVSLDGQILLVQNMPKTPTYSSASSSNPITTSYNEHEDEDDD